MAMCVKEKKHYSFEVFEGLTKVVEYYDFAGRLLRSISTDSVVLPKGTYIKKVKYMSNDFIRLPLGN